MGFTRRHIREFGSHDELGSSVDCPIDRSRAAKRAWRVRLRRREKEAVGKRWQHVDGGCMLCPRAGGKGYKLKGRVPCDDTYEDTKTKREVTFPVTYCRHWEMPFAVDDPREVAKLPGVGRPKYRPAPTPKQKRCQRVAGKAVPSAGSGGRDDHGRTDVLRQVGAGPGDDVALRDRLPER